MEKLNTLIDGKEVKATGFPAFAGLTNTEGDADVIISTLPAAVLAEQGIMEYYAPVIPRNSVFNTTDDVLAADLDVKKYRIAVLTDKQVYPYQDPFNTVIVSRHQGTIDYICNHLPWDALGDDALLPPILSGNVTADDIINKLVIGTLPPHLVSECMAYQAVTVKNFDYAKDGDLTGDELAERIVVSPPIELTEITEFEMTEIKSGGYAIYVGKYSDHRTIGQVCELYYVDQEKKTFQVAHPSGYFDDFNFDSKDWLHISAATAEEIFEKQRQEAYTLAGVQK